MGKFSRMGKLQSNRVFNYICENFQQSLSSVCCRSFARNKLPIDRKSLLLLKKCQDILKDVSSKWPQFEMEGFRNIWILKPGAKSRGRGWMRS